MTKDDETKEPTFTNPYATGECQRVSVDISHEHRMAIQKLCPNHGTFQTTFGILMCKLIESLNEQQYEYDPTAFRHAIANARVELEHYEVARDKSRSGVPGSTIADPPASEPDDRRGANAVAHAVAKPPAATRNPRKSSKG